MFLCNKKIYIAFILSLTVFCNSMLAEDNQEITTPFKLSKVQLDEIETPIYLTEEHKVEDLNKVKKEKLKNDKKKEVQKPSLDQSSGRMLQFGNVKETEVISPTNVPESEKSSTQSVDVITRKEIDEQNPIEIRDILNSQPGIYVYPNGSVGSTTNVRIRGWDRSLVELDGIRINSPGFGGIRLDDILPTGIDRIEILKGPQGTIHGTQAQGGLLSFYTRKGRGRPSIEFESGMGNNSTFRETFNFAGGNKKVDYFLGVTRYDTTGGSPTILNNASINDDYRNFTVISNVGLRMLKNKAEVRNTFRLSNSLKEIGTQTVFPDFDPDARAHNIQLLESFTFTHAPASFYDYNLRFGYYKTRFKFFDGLGPEESSIFDFNDSFKADNNRLIFQTQHNLNVKDINTLSVGYEFEYNDYKTKSHDLNPVFVPDITRFDKDSTKNDVYFYDTINIKDILYIKGGSRITHSNLFGTYATPNISGTIVLPTVQIPDSWTKLRSSYGYSLNEPTVSQMFNPLWGNMDLTPEKLKGWDIGVEQSFVNDKAKFEVTYFNNKVKDLIVFDWSTWTFNNVTRAKTRGVEASMTLKPIKKLKANLNYTYTFGKEIDTATDTWVELRSNPRHRWNYYIGYEFKPGYNIFYKGVSATSIAGQPPLRRRISGYMDMGIGCNAKLLEKNGYKLSFFGVLANILGKKYQPVQGYKVPGIHFIAGLKLTKTF